MPVPHSQTARPNRITVLFDGTRLRVFPDPAVVTGGTPVIWELLVRGGRPAGGLVMTVYFEHGSPMQSKTSAIEARPPVGAQPGDPLETAPEIPIDPGEWKYGVKLEEIMSKRRLADEDPVLRII